MDQEKESTAVVPRHRVKNVNPKRELTAVCVPGRASFVQLRPRLDALAAEHVTRVDMDLGHCAAVGMDLVKRVQTPEFHDRLATLLVEPFRFESIETLARASDALLYVKQRMQDADAQANRRPIPEELRSEANALKNRMLIAVQYQLGVGSNVLGRKNSMGTSRGSVDLASDILRLADVLSHRIETNPGGRTRVSKGDVRQGRVLARRILTAVGMQASQQWRNLAARALTVFREAYEDVRSAAAVVSQDDLETTWPTLQAAVRTRTLRARAKTVTEPTTANDGAF